MYILNNIIKFIKRLIIVGNDVENNNQIQNTSDQIEANDQISLSSSTSSALPPKQVTKSTKRHSSDVLKRNRHLNNPKSTTKRLENIINLSSKNRFFQETITSKTKYKTITIDNSNTKYNDPQPNTKNLRRSNRIRQQQKRTTNTVNKLNVKLSKLKKLIKPNPKKINRK